MITRKQYPNHHVYETEIGGRAFTVETGKVAELADAECICRYGDTVVLSRKLWADLPNHKLNTVAEELGFTFNHHQELDDARACEYIVRSAIEKTGAPDAEALMKMTGQQLKRFVIKRGAKRLLAP